MEGKYKFIENDNRPEIKLGKEYYYIRSDDGGYHAIHRTAWDNTELDKIRNNRHNIFTDLEEAKTVMDLMDFVLLHPELVDNCYDDFLKKQRLKML